jgi:twitching motility two-component system response regulator PilH
MRSFFKKESAKAQANAGGKILIVDDSPTETHIIKGYVEQGGFEVITAEDGESGVEEAKRSQPDLILMDVVMPGLNGFQATRQLSKLPETENIPVILVTTKDQETDRAWGLRQGAREYVVKPVSKDELLGKIHAVLAG